MKTLTFLTAILLACIFFYFIGAISSNMMTKIKIQDEISGRYLKTFGSPTTQNQQCKFDFVVYGDSTECNN